MLKIVTDDTARDDLASSLDELVVEGARRMLMASLKTEVADYVERRQGLVDEAGLRLVVRNGKAAERTLVTGAGAFKVRAPRVNDRREGHRFSSSILPRYARRSLKVGDVLPVLYPRGLSTGDFAPALEEFFGSDAGLSASSITRLLETWTDEYTAFESRDLSGSDFVVDVPDRSLGHVSRALDPLERPTVSRSGHIAAVRRVRGPGAGEARQQCLRDTHAISLAPSGAT